MDAKSKANFINSVAAGQSIPCPQCGTVNTSDSRFCINCGIEIVAPAPKSAPAFAPVVEDVPQETVSAKYVEPVSAFAEGLPTWDIVPPQVMVRRR